MQKLRPPRHATEECHLPPFRRVPLPDRQRMVELIERLDRDTRQPGQSCGWVGGPRAVRAFKAVALDLYQDGLRLTQAAIMACAGIAGPTLARHQATMAELGLLPYSRVYQAEAPRGRFARPRRWGANAYFLPDLRTFERLCEFIRRTAESVSQERILLVWPPPAGAGHGDNPPPEPAEPRGVMSDTAMEQAGKRAVEQAALRAEADLGGDLVDDDLLLGAKAPLIPHQVSDELLLPVAQLGVATGEGDERIDAVRRHSHGSAPLPPVALGPVGRVLDLSQVVFSGFHRGPPPPESAQAAARSISRPGLAPHSPGAPRIGMLERTIAEIQARQAQQRGQG